MTERKSRGTTYPVVYSVMWAASQRECNALLALGWVYAEQRPSHHHFHACLMKWRGPGRPKLPEERGDREDRA